MVKIGSLYFHLSGTALILDPEMHFGAYDIMQFVYL